ncbi:MAG TPA: Cys-tRNA(Pro) deacylase [Acidobacteriota bacterium]|nr:Cys-tRNA(Pro) deacylase [Acidobacteriota bacterium]
MRPPQKTNVMRILDSLGIRYDTASYAVDDDHVDAVTAAEEMGVNPEVVWKTLVAHDEHNAPLVFVIPSSAELNVKKAARVVGAKKIELVNLRDLLPLTGYVRGGCSPIGMKKSYPTWLDETAALFPRIYVNAGARGLQVIVAPDDLIHAANAQFADLT